MREVKIINIKENEWMKNQEDVFLLLRNYITINDNVFLILEGNFFLIKHIIKAKDKNKLLKLVSKDLSFNKYNYLMNLL